MNMPNFITENGLDHWVRGNSQIAQGTIVNIVKLLIETSCPNPETFTFPLDDSINQSGPDGELLTRNGFKQFVPEGHSYWEIGTGENAKEKANKDYKGLTESIPDEIRKESTFIFVTPLSSRKSWKNTWNEGGILKWINIKRNNNEWKDVRVINGSILSDWISKFPVIGHKMAILMNSLPKDFETAYSRWNLIESYGNNPKLLPKLLIANRDEACNRLSNFITTKIFNQIRFDTHFPNQTADFISAYAQTITNEEKTEFASRILIFKDASSWMKACGLNDPHIFVADFEINNEDAPLILQSANNHGHRVIFSAPPGGLRHANSVVLPGPKTIQLYDCLVESGYDKERARSLTNKSGNDLNSLFRIIQGISIRPILTKNINTQSLSVATIIGQWNESFSDDTLIIECLSCENYDVWIKNIYELTSLPYPPLVFKKGVWKFRSRYESWFLIGQFIYKETLEIFSAIAIHVFNEKNPELDLPNNQRFAADIYGKTRIYSKELRHGIVETLALLGAKGDALKNCTPNFGKNIAFKTVRAILKDADSSVWASLNDILPLLAEAAPEEFLGAVSEIIYKNPNIFIDLFKQENSSFGGRNYATGLLWGLESLAWSEEYLVKVCKILGNLSAIDPGGNYINRPSNSLWTILLPWFPQTTGSQELRHSAIRLVVKEQPLVGWKLLQQLLPSSNSFSLGCHKPKWQDYIPEDHKSFTDKSILEKDYIFLTDLIMEQLDRDLGMITELTNFFIIMPEYFKTSFIRKLNSENIQILTENKKLNIWENINELIDSKSKMNDNKILPKNEVYINMLREAADKIKPLNNLLINRKYFSGMDYKLISGDLDINDQLIKIQSKREALVKSIFDQGGLQLILNFTEQVKSTYEVGYSLKIDSLIIDGNDILQDLLVSNNDIMLNFVSGYIQGRFSHSAWTWVETIDRENWSIDSKVQFYLLLPFIDDTWSRAKTELGQYENQYWKNVNKILSPNNTTNIDYAIEKLLDNKRHGFAIQCLVIAWDTTNGAERLAIRALNEINTVENICIYNISKLISLMQSKPDIKNEDLLNIEMKFIHVINKPDDTKSVTVFRELSKNPMFFHNIIKSVYKSKNNISENVDSEERVNIALGGYTALTNWDFFPGVSNDGTFAFDTFKNWFESVKIECTKTGLLEHALNHIGEVMFFAPKDQTGLWDNNICSFIDMYENEPIREGLARKIINDRGAYWFSGGVEEETLASKWGNLASIANRNGYTYLGDMLKKVQKFYKNESTEGKDENVYDE